MINEDSECVWGVGEEFSGFWLRTVSTMHQHAGRVVSRVGGGRTKSLERVSPDTSFASQVAKSWGLFRRCRLEGGQDRDHPLEHLPLFCHGQPAHRGGCDASLKMQSGRAQHAAPGREKGRTHERIGAMLPPALAFMLWVARLIVRISQEHQNGTAGGAKAPRTADRDPG